MNIAIDGRAANLYRGTGIGTYTYQLINNLNQIDFMNNYTIFTPPNASFNFNLKKNFNTLTSSESTSKIFWDNVKNSNSFSGFTPDIYHVPQNGVGLSSDISCKKVITLHDIIPLRMPETCSESYIKIFNNYMPDIIANSDAILTVSEYSKQDICKEFNYPENRVFVTYLAAEDFYMPLDKDYCYQSLNDRYGIPSDFILYVGGFSPRKNITTLLKSFSLLKKKYKKPLKLVIAGFKGKSYPIYKSLSEKLNIDSDVIFPGFIDMDYMKFLYNAAKVFVYPSLYEGFGLPPIEAMSCGTPVISSNVTSMPEILGDSAILIDPKDSNAMCNAILNVLEDNKLKNSLIMSGLKLSSQYNWKKTAYSTMTCYSEVINKK